MAGDHVLRCVTIPLVGGPMDGEVEPFFPIPGDVPEPVLLGMGGRYLLALWTPADPERARYVWHADRPGDF
jgi:hypothetical protein